MPERLFFSRGYPGVKKRLKTLSCQSRGFPGTGLHGLFLAVVLEMGKRLLRHQLQDGALINRTAFLSSPVDTLTSYPPIGPNVPD